MARAPDLAAQRYALLIRQLAAELDRRHGWKSEVARRLGVHPSYVSKIASGERVGVGLHAVELAIARIGLDRRFFHEAMKGEPDHRDFMGAAAPVERHAARPAPFRHAAYARFEVTPLGRTMSQAERETLRNVAFRTHEPTVLTYQLMLAAIRTGATAAEAEAEALETRRAAARAKKRRQSKRGRELD